MSLAAAATLAMASLCWGGCGGIAIIDPVDDGGGGSTTTTTSSTTTPTTTTSGSGGGEPALTVSLSDVGVGMNCMPDIPNDPVAVMFMAHYDNTAGTAAGEANIVAARGLFGGPPKSLTWSFAVDPTASGLVPAGKQVNVSHSKVAGSGSGGDLPCSFCGVPALLELDVVVDGSTELVTASTEAGCAY